MVSRANDEADPTKRNPEHQPADKRTSEVEPKLMELPSGRLVRVIDSKDDEGFEAVKQAK
jgi:hypothetical protein